MNPRAEIWNVLHDGSIDSIEGSVPGDIEMRVGILYLREMFSNDGEAIVVRLTNCTKLAMKIWEDDVVTDDHERIVSIDTEILSTKSQDVPVQIITTLGELEVDFKDLSLSLDNGKQITFEQLCDACKSYWNRWENESRQNKSLHSTADRA